MTRAFFEIAGVKQPGYGEVLRNLMGDVWDFVFPDKNAEFDIDKGSVAVFEEMRHGGIFLTAHYGNHELLGCRLAGLGLPLNAMAQKQKPEFFDRWLQKKRTFGGKSFARPMDTMALMDFVDRDGLFAMLADQDFRKPVPRSIKDDCESRFLGVRVRCNPLPAFILEHRPQTPVFCGYLNNGVLFLKKIPMENFYDHYHAWLENLILKNPAKWYGWFHGRFNANLNS